MFNVVFFNQLKRERPRASPALEHRAQPFIICESVQEFSRNLLVVWTRPHKTTNHETDSDKLTSIGNKITKHGSDEREQRELAVSRDSARRLILLTSRLNSGHAARDSAESTFHGLAEAVKLITAQRLVPDKHKR